MNCVDFEVLIVEIEFNLHTFVTKISLTRDV